VTEAATTAHAVIDAPLAGHAEERGNRLRLFWGTEEGDTTSPQRTFTLCDHRNWRTGVYGGWQLVHEGSTRASSPEPPLFMLKLEPRMMTLAACSYARHLAALAEPHVFAALGLDSLAVEPMPTTWAAGRSLDFEVRRRPEER
jgi:hypothetical protein